MEILCKEKGCKGKVVSKGLCDKHRKRLARHGSTKQTRPEDWGSREKHPLYNSWVWMRRSNLKISELGSWSDFWKFVQDVKKRPGKTYVIKRIDPSKPFSKNNCKWSVNERGAINPEEYREQRREYAKQYRLKHPKKSKCQCLRKDYNITLEEYEVILEKQNGTCDICDKEETATKRGTKEPRMLAVDHCHETGKVRGLLCSKCNTALGSFKDSKELLRKAIQYLTKDT